MTPIQELARDVIALLDAQKAYFRAGHGTDEKQSLLVQCKQMEAQMRNRCGAVLNPPDDLFAEED
jgi:hypothetical protein